MGIHSDSPNSLAHFKWLRRFFKRIKYRNCKFKDDQYVIAPNGKAVERVADHEQTISSMEYHPDFRWQTLTSSCVSSQENKEAQPIEKDSYSVHNRYTTTVETHHVGTGVRGERKINICRPKDAKAKCKKMDDDIDDDITEIKKRFSTTQSNGLTKLNKPKDKQLPIVHKVAAQKNQEITKIEEWTPLRNGESRRKGPNNPPDLIIENDYSSSTRRCQRPDLDETHPKSVIFSEELADTSSVSPTEEALKTEYENIRNHLQTVDKLNKKKKKRKRKGRKKKYMLDNLVSKMTAPRGYQKLKEDPEDWPEIEDLEAEFEEQKCQIVEKPFPYEQPKPNSVADRLRSAVSTGFGHLTDELAAMKIRRTTYR